MRARISFVALAAYPLLDETAPGGIGGAEVRAVTFARGLQRLTDHSLEFIVSQQPNLLPFASGFPISAYEKQRGLRRTLAKLRQSCLKKLTGLPPRDPFFHQLESDVLMCFGVRNDTASMIRSASESGKRTILFFTSDRNVEDAQRRGHKDRGAYGELGHLCRYAILMADRVVVQTPHQQSTLRSALGVESVLIRNPIHLEEGSWQRPSVATSTALWVGRADTFSKRADLCLELARRCPEVRFVMIVNNHDDDLFQKLGQSAPANVDIIEQVPFSEVERHFQRASLLVNTSAVEGFPNSFLQAGKHGRPVVSLDVDPAQMLTEAGCGVCCHGDLERMAKEVRELSQAGTRYDAISENIRHYVVTKHAADICCRQLHELLDELLATRSARVA